MSMSIVRPWEVLFPWMAEIRFERLLGAAMLLAVFIGARSQFRMSLQTATVFLFLSALGLSGIASLSMTLAWDAFYPVLSVVAVYLALQFVIRTPYELLFIVIIVVVTMAAYFGKAEWEYYVNNSGIYDMGVHRMVGLDKTDGHPNAVAQTAVITMPIVLSLWLVRHEVIQRWPTLYRKLFPLFLIATFLLCATSVVLTNSRMGMLASGFFVGLAVLRRKGMWKRAWLVLLAVLMLIATWHFMPEESQNRLRTLWDREAGPANAYTSAEGRVEGFIVGMEMYHRFPWLGVGIGNFKEYRVAYLDRVDLHAHNLLGQLLGETGMIGTVAFIFMMLVTFWNINKLINQARGNPQTDTGKIMENLGIAFREIMWLLLFTGISSHNLYKIYWIWIAAFALVGTRLMQSLAALPQRTTAA